MIILPIHFGTTRGLVLKKFLQRLFRAYSHILDASLARDQARCNEMLTDAPES
jgi:hypothetical protein